jgi:hypothetical protein
MIFSVPPYLLTADVVGGAVVCGAVVGGAVVGGAVVFGAVVCDVVTAGVVVVAALLHPISEEVPTNKTSRTMKTFFILLIPPPVTKIFTRNLFCKQKFISGYYIFILKPFA